MGTVIFGSDLTREPVTGLVLKSRSSRNDRMSMLQISQQRLLSGCLGLHRSQHEVGTAKGTGYVNVSNSH